MGHITFTELCLECGRQVLAEVVESKGPVITKWKCWDCGHIHVVNMPGDSA